METKGILLWAGLLIVCAVILFFSRRIKKQIEENGIETVGVISRIEDDSDMESTTYYYYVRFLMEDGKEMEALLSNPRPGLREGQQVNIKYHPKYKNNARLV